MPAYGARPVMPYRIEQKSRLSTMATGKCAICADSTYANLGKVLAAVCLYAVYLNSTAEAISLMLANASCSSVLRKRP